VQTEIWDKIWRKSRGNWEFCLEEEDVVNPWHQGKRMLKTIVHTLLFRFLQKEKSEQMYKGSSCAWWGAVRGIGNFAWRRKKNVLLHIVL
jgi:hypothetical protein